MSDIETFMASVRAELDALRHDNEALRADNSALRDQLAELRAALPERAGRAVGASAGPDAAPSTDAAGDVTRPGEGVVDLEARPVSRRGMIAAVAGAAGGVILAQAAPAAAANGDAVRAGMTTAATASTIVTSTSGWALQGLATDTAGTGVYGRCDATTGANMGVAGYSAGSSGYGVYGRAASTTGITYGVYGTNSSSGGTGVMGNANAASGTTYGVYGRVSSAAGFAMYSEGRLKVTGRSYLGTPNQAPTDADLNAGSISFYLDQANNQLKVRVKYSGGVLKTGTMNLI